MKSDAHEPFDLARPAKVRPAPIVAIPNVPNTHVQVCCHMHGWPAYYVVETRETNVTRTRHWT